MEESTQAVTQNIKQSELIIQLVVFSLGNEEYAIPINDVKEVVKTPEITSVPNSPDFILGIINLRGNIIPILDLQKVFSLELNELEQVKQHVLVTQTESPYGILVSKVTKVIGVKENDIQEAPEVSSNRISGEYIQGVVIIENENDDKKQDTDLENNHSDGVNEERQIDEHQQRDHEDEHSNQKALLILSVSKIIETNQVSTEQVSQTPLAQVEQNDVQTIEEVNEKESNNGQY